MNYSKYIDHTLLKPDCTDAQIKLLCEEARSYNFASVCVNPGYIKMCAELLKDSGVDVCTVVGFPLGATSTESKVFETKQAVKDGATEIDMVINVSRLKEHDDDLETLAQALMEYETLSGEDIKDVLAGKKIDRTEQIPVPPEKQTKVSIPEV